MTDLADDTAAVAAGYKKTQTDRGATFNPRYKTVYAKPLVGEPGGSSGQELRAEGWSNTSAAAADTQAVAALNGQRVSRWGVGATGNKGSRALATMTHDVS